MPCILIHCTRCPFALCKYFAFTTFACSCSKPTSKLSISTIWASPLRDKWGWRRHQPRILFFNPTLNRLSRFSLGFHAGPGAQGPWLLPLCHLRQRATGNKAESAVCKHACKIRSAVDTTKAAFVDHWVPASACGQSSARTAHPCEGQSRGQRTERTA